MRWRIAAVVMGVLLTGCGGSTTSASDCVTLVRQKGTTFREVAVSGHEATRTGQADRSDCDDMGVEARGAYFPADPDQVNVWTFDGFDPSDVIGVRHSDGKVGVFVAETMSEAEVDDAIDALSGARGAGRPGRANPVGALPDGGAASCVEQYTPQAVGDRAFAFDGTVTSIGRLEDTDANDLGYVPVTFAVNKWFHGADTDSGIATVTVDMASPEVPSEETSVSGGSYAVGSRLLVSGAPRWGGAALDDAVAWGCGFTRYFDEQTAEHWRASAR